MPTNLALGGSALVPVDMYLPYPSASYIFNVFTPLNTSGAMSVCSIMYNDAATNFGCGNDMSLVNTTVTEDATSVGNSHITMYLGTLLNKGIVCNILNFKKKGRHHFITYLYHSF